jgi:hypothetical protein
MSSTGPEPPPRKPPRWGLRTLGFLVLGFVAVFTAQAMGHHTVGTLGSSVIALAGAAYCSVQGVRGSRDRVADLVRGHGTRR